jgi:PDZ domain
MFYWCLSSYLNLLISHEMHVFCINAVHTNRDGRLRDSDQILSINNQPLDETSALRQAVQLLQAAQGRVTLVVAHDALNEYRGTVTTNSPMSLQQSPNSASNSFTVSTDSFSPGHCKCM